MDMIQFEQEKHEKVAKVTDDLKRQAGLALTAKQSQELLTTGRTSIPLLNLVSSLTKVVTYLRSADDEDVTWTLSLNTFSGRFEVTIKNSEITF